MTREDIIAMAQECHLIGMRPHLDGIYQESLERFAALVAAAERKRFAWTQEHWTEYERNIAAAAKAEERERIIMANAPEIEKVNAHIKALEDAVAAERELCAKVCEEFVMGSPYAAAIRARGEQP